MEQGGEHNTIATQLADDRTSAIYQAALCARRSLHCLFPVRDNDVVTDALMIPFYMVMGGVLLEYTAKRRLAEEYQGQNFTRLPYFVRTYHPGAKDTLVEICSHFSDATILVQNIQGVFGCSK